MMMMMMMLSGGTTDMKNGGFRNQKTRRGNGWLLVSDNLF